MFISLNMVVLLQYHGFTSDICDGAGALHVRAKLPYGHRTPKLRFGFSAAHRRHKKITQPKRLSYFLWCRWPDSNRHGIATGGF